MHERCRAQNKGDPRSGRPSVPVYPTQQSEFQALTEYPVYTTKVNHSRMSLRLAWLACAAGMLTGMAGCGKGTSDGKASPDPGSPAHSAASNARRTNAGPIDVCGVITPDVAAAVLGPLPAQPPAKTDNAGFGIYACMYIGPKRSGEGAQTIFSRLTVSAGSGKDATDLLQADADKQHATLDLPGVGDAAKRSTDGSFVWAKQGERNCTAQIHNGLPAALTADQAAAQLGGLCQKVLAK